MNTDKSARRFKNRVTPEVDCLLECKPGDDADFVLASDYDALQSQLARETLRLASLTQQRDGMREVLDLYRLTRNAVIAGLPVSWTDVDKRVNAALTPAQEAQT